MGRWTQYDEDEYRLPAGMQRIGYDADSGRHYFRDAARAVWQGPVGAQFGEMTRVSSVPPSVALENVPEENEEDEDGERRGGREDLEASPRTRRGGYQLLAEDHVSPSLPTPLHIHIHTNLPPSPQKKIKQNQPTIPRTPLNLTLTSSSYRTLFPFFLIIAVVLLLIWRLIVSPGLSAAPIKKCPDSPSPSVGTGADTGTSTSTAPHWVQPGDTCWELARERGWGMERFREVNPRVVCDPLMPGTTVCLPPLKAKAKGVGMGAKKATKRKL
ncbi:hypothetical protein GALMADRAFT_132490 [Galerina marginata CBS 339.88]|uniref:LysM domain-containing protein n=1 Tax=Galerina marginata (strain CBS 339.88) TaxID=685588 RepID=A0A067TU31_GALM3|nr:hypothetical protein GALMADRAFT_132490 [Galerina marginata CBS 339.88]